MELIKSSSTPCTCTAQTRTISNHSPTTSHVTPGSDDARHESINTHDMADEYPTDRLHHHRLHRTNKQRFVKPQYDCTRMIGMIALIILRSAFRMLRLDETVRELQKNLTLRPCFFKTPIDQSRSGDMQTHTSRQISPIQSCALDLSTHSRSASSDNNDCPLTLLQVHDPINNDSTPYPLADSVPTYSTGCSCINCLIQHQSTTSETRPSPRMRPYRPSVIPWQPSQSSNLSQCYHQSAQEHNDTTPCSGAQRDTPVTSSMMYARANDTLTSMECIQQIHAWRRFAFEENTSASCSIRIKSF